MVRALLFALAVVAASPQDWTQWRGPARDGRTTVFAPPETWPERPKQVWKVDAGEGHASPVVAGDRVYLLSRVAEQEALTAYDLATGRQLWRQTYAAPYTMNPAATGHGRGPKSTPLVHGGRVFTLGIAGVLSAHDAGDGRVLWRKDFAKDFPASSPDFGASMSPIADGATVIAHVGGKDNGALTAFDAATGAPRWSWKGDGPAYASPVIADFGGVRQIITQSQSRIVGLALDGGRLLWEMPFTTDYDQNIVTPVVSAGLLIYGGLNKPTVAARVAQAAGKWTVSEVWRNADVPMYMNSPVAIGGVLVGMTHRNRGQFFAADLKTGATLWTSPGRQGENAALLAAGEVVLAVDTDGELIVFRPSGTGYQEVRRYALTDSPVWAHPAPTADGLLVKDATSLTRWSFR